MDQRRPGGQTSDTDMHTDTGTQHAGKREAQIKVSFSIEGTRTTDYPYVKIQRA